MGSDPSQRRAFIVFDPNDRGRIDLYCDASASDLLPALHALVEQLESGAVRMPVAGGVRWVDVDMPQTPEVVRRCKICGCTEDDCSGCVERTGRACHWVAEDLCSACEHLAGLSGRLARSGLDLSALARDALARETEKPDE